MIRLYRCKYSEGYYTLEDNTLTRITYGFRQIRHTHPKIDHAACLAMGLVLIGNNFKGHYFNDSN